MSEEIEFNNGFVTALALFLVHRGRRFSELDYPSDMTINGAADHLFDLEIPKSVSPSLTGQILKFRDDILTVRLDNISHEQAQEFYSRCLKLLQKIDEECFGLKVTVVYP